MLGEVGTVGRDRWEKIHRRAGAGASIRAMARELGLDRKTVRRRLRQTEWKPYQRATASETLVTKKGADKGIVGRRYFHEVEGARTQQILFSVKAGSTGPDHVRELRGLVEREAAAIGALICLRRPTKAMREESASAGSYTSPSGRHPGSRS